MPKKNAHLHKRWAFSGVQRAKGGSVRQRPNYQADNGPGGDGGENRVAAIVIMHPVIAVRRIIQTPIAIIANNDRITVVAIMTTDTIAWDIMTVIRITPDRLIHDIGPVVIVIIPTWAVVATIVVIPRMSGTRCVIASIIIVIVTAAMIVVCVAIAARIAVIIGTIADLAILPTIGLAVIIAVVLSRMLAICLTIIAAGVITSMLPCVLARI